MAGETIFTSQNLVKILFLIGNSNSLKGQMGITKVHMKYTREPLKYRKRRTKLQELKEIRNRQSNKRYYPCTKGLEQSNTRWKGDWIHWYCICHAWVQNTEVTFNCSYQAYQKNWPPTSCICQQRGKYPSNTKVNGGAA